VGALRKFNLEGEQVGEVPLQEQLLKAVANPQMVKDYLVALRANLRQWSANTQTRSEVNRTKKKPYAQKGTGRARQGFLGAPQYRGGGRVFGPRPKFDQHVRINQKERRAAVRSLLVEKLAEDRVCLLQLDDLVEPKTRRFTSFLERAKIEGRRILFVDGAAGVGEDASALIRRRLVGLSLRNIPFVNFMPLISVSGYDVALHDQLIVLDDGVALQELMTLLGGSVGDKE